MSDATLLKMGWAMVAIALIGYAVYQGALGSYLANVRRETSRFPLFAARDALVRLVIENRVRASDEAWKSLYESVNDLLDLDQQLHMVDVTRRYVKFLLATHRDSKLVREVERRKKAEQKLAARVPEFAAAMDDVDRAITHLIACRTTRAHIATVWTFIMSLRILAVALSAGPRLAKSVGVAAIRPSPDSVKGWQFAEREHLAA